MCKVSLNLAIHTNCRVHNKTRIALGDKSTINLSLKKDIFVSRLNGYKVEEIVVIKR